MHFINLMVNYFDRKCRVPINLIFSKIWPEVQATLSASKRFWQLALRQALTIYKISCIIIVDNAVFKRMDK